MKKDEKINYLQDNHIGEWLKTRREEEDKLSASQTMFCVCGRLATGLHEQTCRKFQDKVTALTLARLKHLLPKGKKVA